ncbi:MAG: hypothetical protein MI744_11550 [Pseudomonadales bacterium]|nr:hypothetical protein [Pseudomonadales bacterium]
MRLLVSVLVIVSMATPLTGVAAPTSAKDPVIQLIDMLRENGTLTDEQHQVLSGAILGKSGQTDIEQDKDIDRDTTVTTDGGLQVTSSDGEFSVELGGTLMMDYAHYREDTATLGDGTELRKAKLALEGRMFGDWEYQFEVDVSDGDVDLDDAYFSYVGVYPWQLTIGQFKEPFSLEESTSSRYLTFMERALPNALAPSRALGIGTKYVGGQWTFAAGLFGEEFDDDPSGEADEGWGATSRVTFAPLAQDRRALHFGAGLSFREPDDRARVDFDVRPESHVTDVKYLDTGKIKDVSGVYRYGLETAWVNGPFSLQSEWLAATVERDDRDDLSFSGWYAQTSWFVTGESRQYKFGKGAFGRIHPFNRYGALELAARISELDLSDDDILGGAARQYSLGVNWYVNPQMRLMANYIKVDGDENADADGDVTGDDDPDLFQLRFQADF